MKQLISSEVMKLKEIVKELEVIANRLDPKMTTNNHDANKLDCITRTLNALVKGYEIRQGV
jgi:hypothetical protein